MGPVTKYSTYEVRQRAVQAVLNGMAIVDVATAYQTDRSTIHRWLTRFQKQGDQGLQRAPVAGRPRVLSSLRVRDWRRIVLKPASQFGFDSDLWTSRRVRQVVQRLYHEAVSTRTIRRRLTEAGLSYQKPERQYFQINEKERKRWLREEVPAILETVRKYQAILYFEDEASVSLQAFVGKTWGLRGRTPKVKGTGKRGSVAAASAVSRSGELLFRLYDKRITSKEVIMFLQQMLAHHPRRHLVVVMDQAPTHVSAETSAFIATQKRLHVFYLPKCSPDYNADEKVWNHLKHHELAAHQANTKEDLKDLTEDKLTKMSDDSELIQGIFFRCCIAELLS